MTEDLLNKIDCRGLNCPEPVVKTKNALENVNEGETLVIILDNEIALENVTRFAKSKNCGAAQSKDGDDFIVTITKSEALAAGNKMSDTMDNSSSILFIKSAKIGTGNDELGRVLINGFLNTVAEYENPPKRIFFVNSGVTLTVNGADTVEPLKTLEGKGVEIFSCGTCLDYYDLKNQLAVGKVGNMYDLVDNLFSNRVIYI
jgi:selenium metabolism protein YedF